MAEMVSGQTPFKAESTQKVYEKIHKCQPSYDRKISSNLRDLLDKIFVPDPEMRISISQIKKHQIFKDIDFQISMVDQVSKKSAPFIPPNPLFNEDVQRNSHEEEGNFK
jgi:serine/threonine protein kinase